MENAEEELDVHIPFIPSNSHSDSSNIYKNGAINNNSKIHCSSNQNTINSFDVHNNDIEVSSPIKTNIYLQNFKKIDEIRSSLYPLNSDSSLGASEINPGLNFSTSKKSIIPNEDKDEERGNLNVKQTLDEKTREFEEINDRIHHLKENNSNKIINYNENSNNNNHNVSDQNSNNNNSDLHSDCLNGNNIPLIQSLQELLCYCEIVEGSRKKLVEERNRIRKLNNEMSDMLKNNNDREQKNLIQFEKQRNFLIRMQQKFENLKTRAETTVCSLVSQKDLLRQKLDEADKQIEELLVENAQLKKAHDVQRLEIQNYETIKDSYAKIIKEKEALQSEVENLRLENSKLYSDKNALQSKQTHLLSHLDTLEAEKSCAPFRFSISDDESNALCKPVEAQYENKMSNAMFASHLDSDPICQSLQSILPNDASMLQKTEQKYCGQYGNFLFKKWDSG